MENFMGCFSDPGGYGSENRALKIYLGNPFTMEECENLCKQQQVEYK